MRTIITGLFLLGLVTGCGTRHPKIVVGNAGDKVIRDVTVVSDGKAIYEADVIPPRSSGRSVQITDPFAHQARVKWTRDGSGVYNDTVALQPDISVLYTGAVYIQLGTNSAAQVFYLNEEEFNESVLPWTNPEEWENTPSLPGVGRN